MLVATLALLLVPQAELRTGPWRAWLESPGGELPFGMEIQSSAGGSGIDATLLNGSERIPVTRVERDGERVALVLAHYDARIEAELSAGGERLDGKWTRRSGPKSWAVLAFHATAGEAPRFQGFANAGPGGRIAGRWAVRFSSSEDPAVAVFEEGPVDVVTGTFLTTTGDYRFLEGTFQGDTLKLSCFDGSHAFLFEAKLQEDGSLAGDFWSRDTWHETWTARRDEKAELPDPYSATVWDGRVALADLVFPDLDGKPRSLAEPAFAGRAILLQVFGSWCPNCNDETAYLVELHKRYKDRGLSIVGLAFELTGDFQRDAEQVRRYASRHGVEYPLLIAGTSDKARATEALAALDRVRAYPTTIFLGADGTVHAVHTGFSGPATGPAHDRLRRDFEQRIETLLAEEDPAFEQFWNWLESGDWEGHGAESGVTYRFKLSTQRSVTGHLDEDDVLVRRADRFRKGVQHINASDLDLPVRLVAGGVWIGDALWRIDARAGVLTSPRDAGTRLVPPGRPTPLLQQEEIRTRTKDDRVAALASKDALVRREALYSLAYERLSSSTPLAEALPLLRDLDLDVRITAAWAAGACRLAGAVPALTENLASANAALRRESARALRLIGEKNPEALEPLAALRNDPDPLVRAAASGEAERD